MENHERVNTENLISNQKIAPEHMALMYNASDCTINISDAEGFGLAVDFIVPGQRRLTLYQAAGTNSVQRGSFGGRGPSTPMTLTASIRW